MKKPIFKKWWVWIIVIILISGAFGSKEELNEVQETKDIVKSEEIEKKSSSLDGINFTISNVRNDSTGNWRISTIAENIKMEESALDYYKKYIKDDKEIHAIINFNFKTTTKISVITDRLLDVSVYEYVDKEEHDAKKLFGGVLLREYHINTENGNIEKIK